MNANAPHLDSEAADRNIDRALAALRDAQPRPGLNGRILASLEQRTAAPKPARLGLSANFTLWAATSAAMIAIVSLLVLHRGPKVPARTSTNPVILSEKTSDAVILSGARRANKNAVILSGARRAESKDPRAARRVTNDSPFSATNLTRTAHPLSSRPERTTGVPGQLAGPGGVARSGEIPEFANCPDHHNTGCPTHDDARVVMGGVVNSADPDAQAVADLHAPSHPAPPLPLTSQEKLFLRLLRYGNATQLAELNPLVRAQRDADETTAFKAFFPDPPPLKESGDNE